MVAGTHTHGHRVGEVLLGDPGREAHHDVAVVAGNHELSGQRCRELVEQGRGEHVQRWAGQVHRLVGHAALVVVDDQRVGELDAEPVAPIGRVVGELVDQGDGTIELQVVVERLRHQLHVVVAELAVHDLVDPVVAEQRRD